MEKVFTFRVSSEEDIKIILERTGSPLDLVKINYESPTLTLVLHEDCWSSDENPLEKFWLWSTPSSNGIQTWMYNINDNICFECSPNYSWHFTEPKVTDEYHSFESFIENFGIVKRFNIDVDKAKLWLYKYEEILESLS